MSLLELRQKRRGPEVLERSEEENGEAHPAGRGSVGDWRGARDSDLIKTGESRHGQW